MVQTVQFIMPNDVVKGNKMSYTVPVIEVEDNELGFEIPDDLLAELNLKHGDTLIWEEVDGGWAMRKADG